MMDETVLLLTYYYQQADREHPILRNVIGSLPYLPFDVYISDPLKTIFSKVIVYDYLKRRSEVGLKAMNEEIIALVKMQRPKYVLWTSFQDDVLQTTLQAARQEGSITIGWFFDDDWRFNSYSKYWAHCLDYAVTNSPGTVKKYKQLGTRVIQTIPNTGIALVPEWSHLTEAYDVTFVGSTSYIDRSQYIREVEEQNIPIKVFGDQAGGYISFDKMLNVFQTSKINLNFSKGGGYYWERQIKGRIFQVCMAGGFLLTENTPGIEEYYKIDKEIVCFEDSKEMIEKIRYFLTHDSERKAIAHAGWIKSINEYSSSMMTSKVFEKIEKDLAERPTAHPSLRNTKLKIPLPVRMFIAEYHLRWAIAFLRADYQRPLAQEALELSFQYNRLGVWARCFSLAINLPLSARLAIINFYRSQKNLRVTLALRLQSLEFIRKVAEPIFKRIM